MLLRLRDLTKKFGGLTAVDDFDIDVAEGEIVGLIGPNGAGKIDGLQPHHRGHHGHQRHDHVPTARTSLARSPDQVAALGIGRTFQLNPLFPDFTVLENVTSSFELHPRSSLVDIFFNSRTYRRNEAFIQEKAHEILELVGIAARGRTSWPGTWPTATRRCWEWLGHWPRSPRSSCSTNPWRG